MALSGLMDADRTRKPTGYLIVVTRADKMDVYTSNFPGIDSLYLIRPATKAAI